MHPEVEEYLITLDKWQPELNMLREIIADCGLNEEFKWKHPCYTHKKKNIVLIHEFKNYCAILFFKGALLQDAENILVQQTENTQSARQIRFVDTQRIEKLKSIIKAYIYEAIEIEQLGLEVKKKEPRELNIPLELESNFKKNPMLEIAFKNLTPGRQRGYLFYFSEPKQSITREKRIAKNVNRILSGKGLNDCICGHSNKKPGCDGSHKYLNFDKH